MTPKQTNRPHRAGQPNRPDPRLHANAKFQPTERDLRIAYVMWLTSAFGYRSIDREIEPFLSGTRSQPGQLERARDALQRTTTFVAEKMKITRQSYSKLERGEREGTITLAKLQAAAEALDCEFVYLIRPKSRLLFSKVIFDAILPAALEDWWTLTRRKEDKAKAVYAVARDKFFKHKFRKAMGWSERPS